MTRPSTRAKAAPAVGDCSCAAIDDDYICTLDPNHAGAHVAHAGRRAEDEVHRWPQAKKKPGRRGGKR